MAAGRRQAQRRAGGRRPDAGSVGLPRWLWIALPLALAIGAFALVGPAGSRVQKPRQAQPGSEAKALEVATWFDRTLQNAEDAELYAHMQELKAVVAPEYQESFSQLMDERYDGIMASPLAKREDGDVLIARSVPLTHRVLRTDPAKDKLVIQIWSMSLAGLSAQVTPRVSWVKDEVTLRWLAGKWKVSGFRTRPALVPASLRADEPTPEDEFWREFKGMQFYDR